MGYPAVIKESEVIAGLSIKFLKIFRMWNAINEYRDTGRRNPILKFYILVSFLISVPAAVFQTMSLFMTEFDLKKNTFICMHTLPAISLCCRIIVLWFRFDSQCKLYDLMRYDFFNIPQRLRDKVSDVYKKTTRISNIFCLLPFFWNAGIQIWFIGFPTISVDYIQYGKGTISGTTGKVKILSGWYPFYIEDFPVFQMVLTYESLCLLWAGNVMAMYFSLFFQILMCLYAQFNVLGFRLSSLEIDNKDSKTEQYNKNKELNEMVRDHQKLLRYTEELRSVYNPLVTVTLGLGILLLIIGAGQILLGKTSDPSFLFQLFQVFSFQFIEMALFCFGSSLIETALKTYSFHRILLLLAGTELRRQKRLFQFQSGNLHFAVYCSDWYKADNKFRNAAQMMMMRSRKHSNLTAIIMYPINMETLGSICQFTYTTAALMSGMAE